MGRRVGDANSVDVTAPAATLIEKGELYRIENFTGFAFDQIDATEVDKGVALAQDGTWKCKVPVGTCGTRGGFVKWAGATGVFQAGGTNLADETVVTTPTVNTIAQVIGVRNASGYAWLRLVVLAGH